MRTSTRPIGTSSSPFSQRQPRPGNMPQMELPWQEHADSHEHHATQCRSVEPVDAPALPGLPALLRCCLEWACLLIDHHIWSGVEAQDLSRRPERCVVFVEQLHSTVLNGLIAHVGLVFVG